MRHAHRIGGFPPPHNLVTRARPACRSGTDVISASMGLHDDARRDAEALPVETPSVRNPQGFVAGRIDRCCVLLTREWRCRHSLIAGPGGAERTSRLIGCAPSRRRTQVVAINWHELWQLRRSLLARGVVDAAEHPSWFTTAVVNLDQCTGESADYLVHMRRR